MEGNLDCFTFSLHGPDLPAIRAVQGTTVSALWEAVDISTGPMSPQYIAFYPKCTGLVGIPSLCVGWLANHPGDNTNQLQAVFHTDSPTAKHARIVEQSGKQPLVSTFIAHWGREKWPPFCRRPIRVHILDWKYMNFK